MSEMLHINPDDEISDVIDSVKRTEGSDVAVVLPSKHRSFQTPLNMRLLSQFAKTSGKNVSVVSGDPRIQQMARTNGFTTFASVSAFERGIETVKPALVPQVTPVVEPAAAAAGVAVAEKTAAADGLSSAWVGERKTPPPVVPPVRRPVTPTGPRDRRPIYFAGVAIAVIGILLFLFVAPSATITVTLAATPHSVTPIIQGTTDANAAKQGDHILTKVVGDTETQTFEATPTGSKQLPATSSTGYVVLQSDLTFNAVVPQNEEFDTADGHRFFVSKNTQVNLSDNGSGDYGAPSVPIPVQSLDTGPAADQAADTIVIWPVSAQCAPWCGGTDPHPNIKVNNPAATTGGVDAKTVTAASGGDVSGWQAQVTSLDASLTAKAQAAISQKTGGNVIASDPAGGGRQTSCTTKPGLPAAQAQYAATKITVTCGENAATYSLADVKQALQNDLQAGVQQGDQLADNCSYTLPPQITQASTDGTVIISAQASCFSHPILDLNGMKSQFTGQSASSVKQSIINAAGPGTDVQISQSVPLPLLPFFVSRITVVEQYKAGS